MSSPDAPAAGTVVLDEAERAFERGDWRSARAIARRELTSGEEGRRAAAREMVDRFRPDPQVVVMYLLSVTFFLVAVWSYVLHR